MVNKLIIVGSGIKFMSHLTIEVKAHIEQADKVLYLVNEPAMQDWIVSNSKHSESLDPLYIKNPLRADNYTSIAKFIIQELIVTKVLCVVVYGHPTVFVEPTLLAAKMAITLGYKVTILPGISTEDCLFADLMIDPGTCGCHSFEATDFLLYRREYDCSSHLILWQPFVIAIQGIPINHNPKKGLRFLRDYLQEKYESNHQITLYEAAQYPAFFPRIDHVALIDLPDANITSLTTLYIKPNKQKNPDIGILNSLKSTNN